MLGRMNSLSQRVVGVVGNDWNFGLHDDRSLVHRRDHMVHSDASILNAGRKSPSSTLASNSKAAVSLAP